MYSLMVQNTSSIKKLHAKISPSYPSPPEIQVLPQRHPLVISVQTLSNIFMNVHKYVHVLFILSYTTYSVVQFGMLGFFSF